MEKFRAEDSECIYFETKKLPVYEIATITIDNKSGEITFSTTHNYYTELTHDYTTTCDTPGENVEKLFQSDWNLCWESIGGGGPQESCGGQHVAKLIGICFGCSENDFITILKEVFDTSQDETVPETVPETAPVDEDDAPMDD